ncbi:MAG: transcription antitermination factor NusB [Candidatus Tyrphobacter sp.]
MRPRRRAREQALQALYAVTIGKRDPAEAIDEIVGRAAPSERRTFVRDLVIGTLEFTPQADAIIGPLLEKWTIERLPSIDRCLLRMGTFELLRTPGVPVAVVINEAVELAKNFSTEDSGRFVNGVLSAVARSHGNA